MLVSCDSYDECRKLAEGCATSPTIPGATLVRLVITVNVEPPMQANGLTVSDQRDEKMNLHISVAEENQASRSVR